MTRGGYDIQKLRIEMGNRLVANFRVKLGIDPGTKADDTIDVLKVIERRYENITEGVIEISRRRRFEYDGVISDYADLSLVSHYVALVKAEKRIFRDLGYTVQDFPIWSEYLEGVRGCGPAMASIIISEIDISKCRYPSSLWRYAGLDVADDGRGRSRRKEHLIDAEYTTRDGETATRKSITFNPLLKTKLTGVLGPSFLKAGGTYADIYYGYKNRLENHPDHVEKSKGHRHNMAIRYTVKLFLQALHTEWRRIEGYDPTVPYAEAKLGITHGA